MRLALLLAVVLSAFAANSLLNRAALAGGLIGPTAFALVRLIAGAAMLAALSLARGRAPARPAGRAVPALLLALYVLGFSLAYLRLDAGLGALILFGGVQITMFAAAVIGGARPPLRRWIGAAVALGGLAWLTAPAGGGVDPLAALLMLAAAVGWGLYSMTGFAGGDATANSATNFALAAVPALGLWLLLPAEAPATAGGLALAVVSGAVTSGLAYALWFA
ncbi:MAG: EamA family transporter, partial [Alphaproteobacteria bacterium]